MAQASSETENLRKLPAGSREAKPAECAPAAEQSSDTPVYELSHGEPGKPDCEVWNPRPSGRGGCQDSTLERLELAALKQRAGDYVQFAPLLYIFADC